MPDETLSPVSRTAVGVARIRAAESRRADRLFDDPYAAALVAALDEPAPDQPSSDGTLRAALILHVIVRTVFYDDFLLRATADGLRQVVVLGAGLDTRAWRLPWPADVSVFELDLPAVVESKAAVMNAYDDDLHCRRVVVPIDLRHDWRTALAEAGHRSDLPTAWLAEGLLVYLEPAEAEQLLADVDTASAAGSRLACELGDAARARAAGQWAQGSVPTLWRGGVEDAAGWLDRHGWSAQRHGLAELAESYGRPVANSTTAAFIEARR